MPLFKNSISEVGLFAKHIMRVCDVFLSLYTLANLVTLALIYVWKHTQTHGLD
jgi:hypothetical protein